VKAVNSNILSSYRETYLELSLKSESNSLHRAFMSILVVDELSADIFLGMDSLNKLNIKIDCTKRQITINEIQVNRIVTKNDKRTL